MISGFTYDYNYYYTCLNGIDMVGPLTETDFIVALLF